MKKPIKKIVEESESENEEVIIVIKKRKPTKKTIIVEESSESEEDEKLKVEYKKRGLKSQENKKSSIKLTNPLSSNFENFF